MIQDSSEWHKWRSTRIGSSDAPLIMGTSRFIKTDYKKPKKHHLIEAGRKQCIARKFEPPKESNFVQLKGKEYEDIALLDLERTTKLVWRPKLFTSFENKRWVASLDGYCKSDRLMWECKFVGREKYEKAINEFMPLSYRVGEDYYPQIIHQSLVSGLRSGYFSVCVDNQIFKSIPKGEVKCRHFSYHLGSQDMEYMNDEYRPQLIEFTKEFEHALQAAKETPRG